LILYVGAHEWQRSDAPRIGIQREATSRTMNASDAVRRSHAPLTMHPLLVAIAICVVIAMLEAVAAGSNPSACLRSLNQPRWSPPAWLWYFIGLLYYGACLISLWLVLRHDPSLAIRWRALELLIAVMVANALWNVVFFRFRALAISFWIFLPYSALVLVTVFVLYRVDGEAAAPFIPYLLYLPYACAWSYSVWRRNEASRR